MTTAYLYVRVDNRPVAAGDRPLRRRDDSYVLVRMAAKGALGLRGLPDAIEFRSRLNCRECLFLLEPVSPYTVGSFELLGDIKLMRKVLFFALSFLYVLLIFGAPFALCASLCQAAPAGSLRGVALLVSPLLYSALYLLIAGILSLPHQRAIVAGRFPRDVAHPIYFHRRLYGLCWTAVYYFVPIYHLALSFPLLKRILFRLFGYRGDMGFTTYPDTWIRDLPLLQLGKGAYLSNKATIGTNIALPDGSILVEPVTIEEDALIGHLVLLAPGTHVKRGADIGVGTAIGLKSTIGEGAKINPGCSLEHGVKLGAGVKVGAVTYIASAVEVARDIIIPSGVTIPARTRITCQQEAAFFARHIEVAKVEKKSWAATQVVSRFPLEHL